jgi:hypothetical protein
MGLCVMMEDHSFSGFCCSGEEIEVKNFPIRHEKSGGFLIIPKNGIMADKIMKRELKIT